MFICYVYLTTDDSISLILYLIFNELSSLEMQWMNWLIDDKFCKHDYSLFHTKSA